MILYVGVSFYLGCSWQKPPGNPAPHQTLSPEASHTDD